MDTKMNCMCRLCQLRRSRGFTSPHPPLKTRPVLQRQTTLPTYFQIPETYNNNNNDDVADRRKNGTVHRWTHIIAHQPGRPRAHTFSGESHVIENDLNEDPPEDLRRMTLADPMDVRKSRSKPQLNSQHQKRNSWDINSGLHHSKGCRSNPPSPSRLHSNSLTAKRQQQRSGGLLSSSTGDVSLSKSLPVSQPSGDIQIIQSPPTPEQSLTSSTSDVLTSANTSIGDISIRSAPTPPFGSGDFPSRTSSPSSSVECSPEIRRKLWHSKILHLKDDIEKVCHKVKEAGHRFGGGVEDWRTKRSKSRREPGDSRVIRVEHMDITATQNQRSLYKQQKRQFKKFLQDEEEEFEFPDHRVSPALKLNSLQDCEFTAEASLVNLPEGDVTLRVSGYRVIIIINRRRSKTVDDNHRIVKPIKYGELDIPIYVEPSTLCFQYEEETNSLKLNGKMKGYDTKKYSLSNDDLRVVKSSLASAKSPSSSKHKFSLFKDRKSNNSAENIADDKTAVTSDVSPRNTRKTIFNHSGKGILSAEAFRERAYTK